MKRSLFAIFFGVVSISARAAVAPVALDTRLELCAALELSAAASLPGALFRDDGGAYAASLRAPRMAGHPAVATYVARLSRQGRGEVVASGPVVELLNCLDEDLRVRRDEACRALPFPLAAADFAAKTGLATTLAEARPLPESTTAYAAAADARLAALGDFAGTALPANRLALSPLMDPARSVSASVGGMVVTGAPLSPPEVSTAPEHETLLAPHAALSLWTRNAAALVASLPAPDEKTALALQAAYEARPGACVGEWRACLQSDLSVTMVEAALAWSRAQQRVPAYGESASIGPRREHLGPLRSAWTRLSEAPSRPALADAAPGFYAALMEGLAAVKASPAAAPALVVSDSSLGEAVELYRKGDARGALARLRGSAALKREDPEALITQAVLLGSVGKGAQAIRSADSAVEKARADALVSSELLRSLLSTRASLRKSAGDESGAARDLEEARLLESAPSAP